MAKKKSMDTPTRRKVTFSFESHEAQEVFLSGDFNNWDQNSHPMKNDGKGIWKKTLMLVPDKYEYRFLVDGEWENNPNDESCPNTFGTFNNYVIVLPPVGK